MTTPIIDEESYAELKNTIQHKKFIVRGLKRQPCADCNVSYPYYVMDFDHREPRLKKFNISKGVVLSRVGVEELAEEMSKCDVVCANCHRIRTYTRRCKV